MIEQHEFLKAINYIDTNIPLDSIRTRLLKARALEGLGRYEEIDELFYNSSELSYPTEDDLNVLGLSIKANRALKRDLKADYFLNLYRCILGESSIESMNLQQLKQSLINELATQAVVSMDIYIELSRCYLLMGDIVKSLFYQGIYAFVTKRTAIEHDFFDIYKKHFNYNEVFSVFSKMTFKYTVVFILESNEQEMDYLAMEKVLHQFGKNAIRVHANRYMNGDKECSQATLYDYLIDLMQKNEDFIYIIAERTRLDCLYSHKVDRKYLHYLTNPKEYKNQTNFTAFAYIGNYLTYLSDFYSVDAYYELAKKSTYDFSIVIPVRNNIETLPYTLQSCLAIEYDNFEIVISDNSDNDELEAYIEGLNSERINYYRTPMPLQLGRSFEYAYLKAKGDFLIPIGADEGIIKSSLKTLQTILNQHPEELVFTWETLSYNWPQSGIIGEEDKIVLGAMFSKRDIHKVEFIDSKDKLNRVIKQEEPLLTMPTLYQRSGMRRKFLSSLVANANTIVDGFTQDIFMGVLVLSVTEHYVAIKSPIVVIGNSNYSSGAGSKNAISSNAQAKNGIEEFGYFSRGNFIKRGLHSDVPLIHYAWWIHFLTCVLNIADRGLYENEFIKGLDWKRIVEQTISEIPVFSIFYEEETSKLLSFAHRYLCNEDYSALELEYDNYFEKIDDYLLNVKEGKIQKNYEVGLRKNGSLALDGEKFGVKNIYEATQFIENILNL